MLPASFVTAAARAPRTLVTIKRSDSSMMPLLMPCSSSPPPGGSSKVNMSTISATAICNRCAPDMSVAAAERANLLARAACRAYLALPHANSLDDDNVVARRLAQHDGVCCAPSDAAWKGGWEGVGRGGEGSVAGAWYL